MLCLLAAPELISFVIHPLHSSGLRIFQSIFCQSCILVLFSLGVGICRRWCDKMEQLFLISFVKATWPI